MYRCARDRKREIATRPPPPRAGPSRLASGTWNCLEKKTAAGLAQFFYAITIGDVSAKPSTG
eukprot:2916278-Prymnesium_polylepis.1